MVRQSLDNDISNITSVNYLYLQSLSDKKRIRDELSMIELLISQLETQIIKQNLTFKPFIPN